MTALCFQIVIVNVYGIYNGAILNLTNTHKSYHENGNYIPADTLRNNDVTLS